MFASITFGDGFFQFEDNKVSLKQAPGHNHENTIFQPGQSPFKTHAWQDNGQRLAIQTIVNLFSNNSTVKRDESF